MRSLPYRKCINQTGVPACNNEEVDNCMFSMFKMTRRTVLNYDIAMG